MKRRKDRGKRLWCSLLAILMVAISPLPASAETLEEIQTQQDKLQAENRDLQARLDSLRDDKAQKQEYQDTLQEQINLVQQQILTTRENISGLNDSITKLTMKLDKSKEEIADTIEQFRRRVVAIYKTGSVSTLQILLDSSSFSDFSMRSEMLKAMSRHDQQLVDKINAYIEKTRSDREKLQNQKKEVAELQKSLEGKQDELDSLYEENQAAIGEIQGQMYATENQMEVNEEELAAAEARIQEIIAAQKKAEEEARQQALQQQQQYGDASEGSPVVNPPSDGSGGDFSPIWPMPGVSYISCPYGGYPGHRGMDIAGDWGTPIVAAADGLVIEANNYDSWGYSWGYYVLVYHNGTYSTRYAHLSSVAVNTGQYVAAGTIIGYEGETGNAYGAHLHFEVYENGSRVDPALFL